MIRYVDVHTENCSNLGDLKGCLDYPACGYYNGNTILIAGWVLPADPLNNDIQVVVRVDDKQNPHDYQTNKIQRPDVFKAKLSDIEYPESVMQVGFSVRIPFSLSATASIIIIKDGHELTWYKINVVVDNQLTNFIKKLDLSNEKPTNNINIDSIVSNTKLIHSHNFEFYHPSIIHSHLKKIRKAVSNDEFIVSLYKSKTSQIDCVRSDLNFELCSSKSLNDHNFLFCCDESGIEFIVHQHVTSIDGVYYPSKGIYYSLCHGSQNRLAAIIEMLLSENNYFEPTKNELKAFLIGHGRPYHFMYDGMLGLETIHHHVKEIDADVRFYTLESNAFIDAPKVYNSKQEANFINNKVLTRLEQEGNVFIKIGALFGSGAKEPAIIDRFEQLDKKIISYVKDKHDENNFETLELKKHFPIIWLGVTGQKRAWLEQTEGYSNIINKLYESFPGMAVAFDGWTSSLVTIQRDKTEIENDRSIISEIKNRIASDITIVDLIGETIDKKIHIGSMIDCAVVNYSTGSMNISRICGRPCITHMNNSFSPARSQHIHKNAHHIADEYVTDVIDKDSRIDATSYHINWEDIYNAMILHLGQHNFIQKRW